LRRDFLAATGDFSGIEGVLESLHFAVVYILITKVFAVPLPNVEVVVLAASPDFRRVNRGREGMCGSEGWNVRPNRSCRLRSLLSCEIFDLC
jgi:hypothetical protein